MSATSFDFNIEPIFPPKALRWAAVSQRLAGRQAKRGGEEICLSGKGNPSGTLRLGRMIDQGVKKYLKRQDLVHFAGVLLNIKVKGKTWVWYASTS